MQRLDRWRTWDLLSVQIHAFSIDSLFLGSRQQFSGRATNQFLAVADVLGCGELVEERKRGQATFSCLRPLVDHALTALRTGVNRQQPFGTATWQSTIAATLGLQSTLRQHGRPRTSPEK